MKRPLLLALFPILLFAHAAASPAFDGTATYTDWQAGYAIDYPADSRLSSGLDAALGFNTVFIDFPSASEGEFAGAIITVFDNPERVTVDQFARERFGLKRDAPGRVRAEWINGMPALLALRPSPLTGEDAAVALVEGDGVIIRIGLPYGGGGIDGPIEPPAAHYDWFNRIVHSIRRVPRQAPAQEPVAVEPGAEPPAALVFQMPFNVAVTAYYDEQYGVAISNTAYGVRNLSLEHRRTCFGVDWPRLLHSGIDWFRADGQLTAPTDVLSVADGIVDWYDPNYNSYPGKVVIVRHRLEDGRNIYSVYSHLGPDVSVVQGQIVAPGQRIGSLLNQGDNTHLHFEMRYFFDGRNIYGAYTNCNSATLVAGRGYTYRVHPDSFPLPGAGYVDPMAFIQAHSGGSAPVQADLTVARLVTSTLRLDGDEAATILKNGSPASIDAPIGLPGSAVAGASATRSFTLTAFIYLPFLARELPQQEPACIEGQQLLANAGLEGGPASAPWVQVSNGVADLIQEDRPFAGGYSLWLGGRDIADEEALQAFVAPYYTEGITLTFQRFMTTTETQLTPFDRFEVVVENNAGVEVTPRLAMDNASAQPGEWVAESIVFEGMQPFSGQRLRLSLKIATDSTLPTSFFIDDLSLATRCAP